MYICSTNNKALENMNKKDKELLLKDLCARLPYGVIVEDRNGTHTLNYGNTELYTEHIKPYLRPLSSMTKEEYEELKEIAAFLNNIIEKHYDTDPKCLSASMRLFKPEIK